MSGGNETVQVLDLADYDQGTLEVDFRMDGSDLLIPLERGDYLVYYPAEEFDEMPLDSSSQVIVGMIFYYDDEIDLADYHVNYYCHRDFTEGPAFVLLVVSGTLLVLTLVMYTVALHSYRQAEKELEIRKSGLSCMSELYSVIYLVDLTAHTIVPVGVDEKADSSRPKSLSPGDQLKNLMQIDADSVYQEAATDFVNLNTIRERMAGRNNIVFEYESPEHGWSRICFIAMDRNEAGVLEKVLFTVEQINEEKQELGAILDKMMEAKTAAEEQEALLEGMPLELKKRLDVMGAISERIQRESTEEKVLDHVRSLRGAEARLSWVVDNAVDYVQISAGESETASVEYGLKDLMLDARDMARSTLGNGAPAIEVEATRTLPRSLYGDEPRLCRVIANLLIEAATAEDVIGVKLGVFGKTLDGTTLHMLVSVTSLREAGADVTPQPSSSSEAGGVGIIASRAMLALMGSQLNVTDARGGGKNLYFEIDQRIVDMMPVGSLDEADGEGSAR